MPENGYGLKRSDLKTGVEIAFFGLKKGQDLENRAAHPHEEFPGLPPPPTPGLTMLYRYRAFSHDVTTAILVSQNNGNEINLRSAGLLSEKALFQETMRQTSQLGWRRR